MLAGDSDAFRFNVVEEFLGGLGPEVETAAVLAGDDGEAKAVVVESGEECVTADVTQAEIFGCKGMGDGDGIGVMVPFSWRISL